MHHGFWATVDHWRTWESFDGPVRAQIVRDRELTGYTTAAIAIEYNLTNSLPWKGGFARFDRVAQRVNRIAETVEDSATMAVKRDAVVELADALQMDFALPAVPSSAASKLFWFVRPTGWTMFDKHAFNALFDKRSENRRQDLKDFYDVLIEMEFSQLGETVSMLAASDGISLNGDRVLDKLLMLRGSAKVIRETRFGDDLRRICRDYLESANNSALAAVASRLEDVLSVKLLRTLGH
ncbi:hypothetical protein [Rhizobium leguminosarum]|uniref:hypothetical protein n=1 Tax=Rhizobium leguminosarum TaxID=384 RepID=UPI000B92A880|nr:hypothetical protein [Rhizobium leguminosarum]ASS56452.1 hypothetical protein CHR56_18875 [Rhizobium leguminosarum bv. viciae]WSH63662.1 hypothetical protein U8Q05_18700 [Rhizobium ruizarguesonis]